ncbi:MAG: D-alanyl-D-alanine carboxypeptidase, partial [Peptococcaceae bacterium]|nr:D-alanyl-D-alanine carboxypeptidase [Peptococcaceae bacterium]
MFNQVAPALAFSSSSSVSQIPTVNGEAAVLVDADSGQILFAKNSHEHLPIASITKIMTAIVALDKGNLDSVVTIQPDIMDRKNVYGTLLYLEPGEKFTLRQLLYGMLLNSANDAAMAVADYIGGNETNFVQMMNATAQQLGATDTHFTNPDGLSEPNHYSSASDMALFARYAMQNPVFAEIVQTKTMDFPRSKPKLPNKLYNIDHMLWLYSGVDGVKTGYTAEARNTIVTSATRNGRRLLVVVLRGDTAKSIYADDANLLDYGFNDFTNQVLAQGRVAVDSVHLAGGSVVKLAPPQPVYGTSPIGKQSDFVLKPQVDKLSLPIQAGETLGKLNIWEGTTLVQTVPLIALNNIAKPNVLNAKPIGSTVWFVLPLMGLFAYVAVHRRQRRLRRRTVQRNSLYRYYHD